jgi:hypothetical protein
MPLAKGLNSLQTKKKRRPANLNVKPYLERFRAFNKSRKRAHEKPVTLDQFIDYLYGVPLPVEKPAPKKDFVFENPRSNERQQYPSYSGKSVDTCEKPDDEYKHEVSKKYTVSLSYNKGNYCVIPNDEIKYIGR